MKELYFYRVVMVCLVLGGTFLAGHHYGHSTFDHLAHLTGQASHNSSHNDFARVTPPAPARLNLATRSIDQPLPSALPMPAVLNSPQAKLNSPVPLNPSSSIRQPISHQPNYVQPNYIQPNQGQLQHPAQASFAQPQPGFYRSPNAYVAPNAFVAPSANVAPSAYTPYPSIKPGDYSNQAYPPQLSSPPVFRQQPPPISQPAN